MLERTETVEDTLRVQKELSNIREQLEQSRGRIQYREHTSATSLITISIRPASSPEPLVEPGWSPLETGQDTLCGLAIFGQGLADVGIRAAIFTPVLLPILAVALWV